MSLIVAISLSSSSSASVADAAVGILALAFALVVAIVRMLLAVICGLLCSAIVCGRRVVCSWRRGSLIDG